MEKDFFCFAAADFKNICGQSDIFIFCWESKGSIIYAALEHLALMPSGWLRCHKGGGGFSVFNPCTEA